MKKSLVSGCIGLVFASLLLLAGCPNPAVVDPNNYSISGTVAVDAGVDVTQASVELWQGGAKANGPIQPDSSGKFSFPDVRRGDTYIVKINMGSTASWTSGSISVPNAPHLKAVLTQTKFTIKGKVSSTISGADVTQAKLYLVQAGDELAETSPVADGSYEFFNVGTGEGYYIRVNMEFHKTIFGEFFNITDSVPAIISGKDFTVVRELPLLLKVSRNDATLSLVWSQVINIPSTTGFTVTSSDPTPITISNPVKTDVLGEKWNFTLSRTPDIAEDLTLSYDNAQGTVSHPLDQAKPESFSNMVVRKPFVVLSAEATAVDSGYGYQNQSIRVYFSDGVASSFDAINSGFSATRNGQEIDIYYVTTEGHEIREGEKYVTFSIFDYTNIWLPSDVFTVSYNSVHGTIQSVNGDSLPALTSFKVMNKISDSKIKVKLDLDSAQATDSATVELVFNKTVKQGSLPASISLGDALGVITYDAITWDDNYISAASVTFDGQKVSYTLASPIPDGVYAVVWYDNDSKYILDAEDDAPLGKIGPMIKSPL